MAGAGVIFLLPFIFSVITAKERVPVLIWNYSQSNDNYPVVPALQTIDYATFQSKYLANFEPTNIILFIQDALSVEDLSSHASEFKAVKKWMDESHHLYLPNVEDPAHLTHDLASHGYNVVTLEPGVPAAGLNLKQQNNNLVVVKLPSTLTNPSRSHALQKAVEVMQNVISKVGAKRKFTFIFTGLKPSMDDSSSKLEGHVRVPRAAVMLQQRAFHSVNCVKLYFKANFTLYISHNNSQTENIKINFVDENSLDTGDCRTDTAKISMKFLKGMEPFTKIITEFNYNLVKNSWGFTDIGILLDSSTTVHTLELVNSEISGIPRGMSYSCSQTLKLASNSTSEKMEVEIDGVQMQAFFNYEKNNSTFGPAWDCVGFFTVPIWVSLLTTLLLLLILTMGLYMLSDIKTMDRFDDPKGQPIMVPATSD